MHGIIRIMEKRTEAGELGYGTRLAVLIGGLLFLVLSTCEYAQNRSEELQSTGEIPELTTAANSQPEFSALEIP